MGTSDGSDQPTVRTATDDDTDGSGPEQRTLFLVGTVLFIVGVAVVLGVQVGGMFAPQATGTPSATDAGSSNGGSGEGNADDNGGADDGGGTEDAEGTDDGGRGTTAGATLTVAPGSTPTTTPPATETTTPSATPTPTPTPTETDDGIIIDD